MTVILELQIQNLATFDYTYRFVVSFHMISIIQSKKSEKNINLKVKLMNI